MGQAAFCKPLAFGVNRPSHAFRMHFSAGRSLVSLFLPSPSKASQFQSDANHPLHQLSCCIKLEHHKPRKFTLAVLWLAGVRHVDLVLHLMAQPPWDATMELSANKPFYILHYTYGQDFTLDGKMIAGGAKVADSHVGRASCAGEYTREGRWRCTCRWLVCVVQCVIGHMLQRRATIQMMHDVACLKPRIPPVSLLVTLLRTWRMCGPCGCVPGPAGKYGAWHFDKRTYMNRPPPRHLGDPPAAMKNDMVRALINSINEASQNIPCWDDYFHTGKRSPTCDEVIPGSIYPKPPRTTATVGDTPAATPTTAGEKRAALTTAGANPAAPTMATSSLQRRQS